MRRALILGLVLVLGAALLAPSSAIAGKKKKKDKGKKQEVTGSIDMMAPFYNDPNACYSGLHRRLAIFGGDNVNGIVGYHFDVEPTTIGKPFILEVTGGQGGVDLDITYYTEFGTTDQATDTGYAPYNIGFDTRAAGGESGIIPEGDWTKALVCMHTGVGATFDYQAGKGVKLPK